MPNYPRVPHSFEVRLLELDNQLQQHLQRIKPPPRLLQSEERDHEIDHIINVDPKAAVAVTEAQAMSSIEALAKLVDQIEDEKPDFTSYLDRKEKFRGFELLKQTVEAGRRHSTIEETDEDSVEYSSDCKLRSSITPNVRMIGDKKERNLLSLNSILMEKRQSSKSLKMPGESRRLSTLKLKIRKAYSRFT